MKSPPQFVTVTFSPSGKSLQCEAGSRIYDVILQGGLPLGSSCDGDAMCGWCLVTVVSGEEGLSEVGEVERRLLTRRKAEANERIACETRIYADTCLSTTYW